MKNKGLRHGSYSVSGIFVFLLIGIFAIASIMLVLAGINVYGRVTEGAAFSVERQLALSYLVNKIHAYDSAGNVSIKTRDDMSILCLREEIDGDVYETHIFYHDGGMYEQFSAVDEEFDPEMGERLTDVQRLEFNEAKPNLLHVKVMLPDGSVHSLHFALSSGQVG